MVSSQNINEEADRDSANWEEVIGARFKPTDWVLTGYYLAGKLSGRTDGPIFPYIKEVDVYQLEPSKLPSIAHDFGDGNMYFFSPVHMKYRKGKNIKRIAGDGCWKKSQKPSYVTGKDGVRIGIKTSLAYHKNDTKSGKPTIKTQWLMKEFMLLQDQQPKLALCVVYHHDNKRKQPEGFANNSRKRQHHPCNINILEQTPPFDPKSNCCQNMMNGSSDLYYNPYPSADTEKWSDEFLDQLDQALRFNQFENPSSNNVSNRITQSISVNHNQDPSWLNSEEPLCDLGTFMFENDTYCPFSN